MLNFTDIKKKAIEATTFSAIMTNREKMTIDELIFNYPEGVHITEVDMCSNEDNSYVIFTTSETPDYFINGGCVITDIINNIIEHDSTKIQELNEVLQSNGGLNVKFKKSKTRNNRTVTTVTIL